MPAERKLCDRQGNLINIPGYDDSNIFDSTSIDIISRAAIDTRKGLKDGSVTNQHSSEWERFKNNVFGGKKPSFEQKNIETIFNSLKHGLNSLEHGMDNESKARIKSMVPNLTLVVFSGASIKDSNVTFNPDKINEIFKKRRETRQHRQPIPASPPRKFDNPLQGLENEIKFDGRGKPIPPPGSSKPADTKHTEALARQRLPKPTSATNLPTLDH